MIGFTVHRIPLLRCGQANRDFDWVCLFCFVEWVLVRMKWLDWADWADWMGVIVYK
jgi:hypothetical protein